MIAQAFADDIAAQKYTCYACAIMPDHVHVLIRKHKHPAEVMIANLQQASRRLLRDRNIRHADHPTWGGPGWKASDHLFREQYRYWPSHLGARGRTAEHSSAFVISRKSNSSTECHRRAGRAGGARCFWRKITFEAVQRRKSMHGERLGAKKHKIT